jgi:hypothetical protein
MRRAASAPIPSESAASIEALGHARVPLGGFRPDHRAGVELTATDTQPLPSPVSEQFPVETRAIGVSLGFSTAVSIFGGHAPLVAMWLISVPETELLTDLHRAASSR